MTSIMNKENEKMLFMNNKGQFNNKQQNKGKNLPKLYQKQTAKGLSVLDQNVLQDKMAEKEGKALKLNKVPIQKNNVILTELNVLPSPIQADLQANQNDDIIISSPSFNSNDMESEKEYKNLAAIIDESHKALIKTKTNVQKMYCKRESDNLLVNEGESSYKYNKSLEENVFKIPTNLLSKHKISPCIRTRMIDWMLEVLSIYLTLVPVITGGELKSKPTQNAVKLLQEAGIRPDILICRCETELDEGLRKKLAMFCNVSISSSESSGFFSWESMASIRA